MRVEQSSHHQQQHTQPNSIQDNFVRKYQSLLSSGNFKNIRSPYFQYSEGFTDPLPTGGSGGGGGADIRTLESIEFPEFNQSQSINQPLVTEKKKKTRKKPKGGGGAVNKSNKGRKKTKKTNKEGKKKTSKLSKNQIIGKLLKELTSTKKKK